MYLVDPVQMKRTWKMIFGRDTHMGGMSIHAKMTLWLFSFDQVQQITIIFNIYSYAECKEPWI